MKSIDINDVKEIKDAHIIDVREPVEYEKESIPGAVNIPMLTMLTSAEDLLLKNTTYFIMSFNDVRSKQVVSDLEDMGFDVVLLEGGYNLYKAK